MKKIFGLLVVVILIAAFFIPQILSMPFGKKLFEERIGRKIGAQVTIGSCELTWLGPQGFKSVDFTNSEMSGSIDELSSNVPLWSLSQFGDSFSLKNGQMNLSQYNDLKIEKIEATIQGQKIDAKGVTNQGGYFSIQGKIHSKKDIDLVANFQTIPSPPLDYLLKAKGLFTAAVGSTFDLTATLVYNRGEGDLKADFSSPNTTLHLNGEISQNSLLLKEPATLSLLFSPELSRALGGQLLSAKNPITLQLESAGSSIPLQPFSWDRLAIEKGTLNLGKLVCTGLHPIISLLALLNNAPIASSTGVVWLTPASFSIDKSTLHLGRIDALIANAIHLCAWGNISLPNTKLDMKLGVPADTLEQSLGIKNLSRKYVLQIPVRGTLQNPKFDTGSASATIATLVAGKQISKALSKKTGALGNLMGQIGQAAPLTDDPTVPPPNRPFPWE